ncbi:DUF4214 domain-containing protein [Halarcobacter sp.]|uniref:DUF4214 domain-containing protein n=1 Tax=Halarcobacter sp. TaxID=2321133 RepID=UPI002AA94495|nr:DUF4214 domain-containing protein [Halarcobacter sp.]
MKRVIKIILFSIIISFRSFASDIYEPNDNMAAATVISYGTYTSLEMEDSSSEDWFRLDVTEPGLLYIKMTPKVNPSFSRTTDINVVIKNSSDQLLAANLASGTEEILYFSEVGTYYIVVDTDDAGGPYDLEISNSFSALGDDASEQNDNKSSATVLSSTNNLSLVNKDEDWFKINVSSGNVLATDITFNSLTGTNYFILYGPSNTPIYGPQLITGDISLSYNIGVGHPAGDYYYRIYGTSNDTYNLQVSNNTVWQNTDSYEPNDDFASAKEINYGEYSLEANNADDDWFKINVTEPGLLYLEMTPTSGKDINMVLYSSSNTPILQRPSGAGVKESIQYHVHTPGLYYIKVGTDDFDGSYSLKISNNFNYENDDANDNNSGDDTFSNATTVNSANFSISNQVSADEDWYKVYIPYGRHTITLNFDYVDLSDNTTMFLYNDTGSLINASNTEDLSNGKREIATDIGNGTYNPGYYYLRIVGEGQNNYSLNFHTDTIWATELNYGPIGAKNSIALFDIDNDGVDEIFVGTGKSFDSNYNEVLPAGLICLEKDGTVKWEKTFPAMSDPDPTTGKYYNTTSISSPPTFGDIDNDGEIEIVIGVGANSIIENGVEASVGQWGDLGGVYALEKDGTTKWFHEGFHAVGDAKKEGVFGSPIIFDIDSNGTKEVIFGSWDQRAWVLDGVTGQPKEGWPVPLLDTIWSTFKVTDINKDGKYEILASADITENPDPGTTTGGIFHVISANGKQNIPGFDQFVGTGQELGYETLKGKWEEQTLWSTPQVADIDGDDYLEIIYGTGRYHEDPLGNYVKVFEHDGNLKYKLDTNGRTSADPIVCDLDNDGDLEIVAATANGYIYAWDHLGNRLFETKTTPIFRTGDVDIDVPLLAVDLTNNGNLEIIYTQGPQIMIVDKDGNQLTDTSFFNFVTQFFPASPAITDFDIDGIQDIISGGMNTANNKTIVYRWAYSSVKNNFNPRSARYQFNQTTYKIEEFIKRMYSKVLGRTADPVGLNNWLDNLTTKLSVGADVAKGFVLSQEFINKNVTDDQFIEILYESFFNRSSDPGGFSYWKDKLDAWTLRQEVLNGFIYSTEFSNLSNSYGILPFNVENTNLTDVEKFVSRFYSYCLGRDADSGGLNDWTYRLLNNISSGSDIAKGFIFSQEFTNKNYSNKEYLIVLYKAFFDREPDQGGYDIWFNDLENNLKTREEVLDGFLGSQEFISLAARYGINP